MLFHLAANVSGENIYKEGNYSKFPIHPVYAYI